MSALSKRVLVRPSINTVLRLYAFDDGFYATILSQPCCTSRVSFRISLINLGRFLKLSFFLYARLVVMLA